MDRPASVRVTPQNVYLIPIFSARGEVVPLSYADHEGMEDGGVQQHLGLFVRRIVVGIHSVMSSLCLLGLANVHPDSDS